MTAEAPEKTDYIRMAIDGEQPAFDRLYADHALLVYNLALRSARNVQDAEDICQEVWLKVHRELHRLREPAAFPGWVRSVTLHVCTDVARRRRPAQPLPEEPQADPDSGVEEAVADQEERQLVWQALGALAPRQSTALFMREVEGYEYRRIASALDASVSGVETLLFRARKALARSYGAIQASAPERCRQAQHVMAAVMDGEGDPVKRRSLDAHLAGCQCCRVSLEGMQRATKAYAALPLLPLAAGHFFVASRAAGGGVSFFLAKLLGLLSNAKAALAPLAVATTITTGLLVTPLVTQDGAGSDDKVSVMAQPALENAGVTTGVRSLPPLAEPPALTLADQTADGTATPPGDVSDPATAGGPVTVTSARFAARSNGPPSNAAPPVSPSPAAIAIDPVLPRIDLPGITETIQQLPGEPVPTVVDVVQTVLSPAASLAGELPVAVPTLPSGVIPAATPPPLPPLPAGLDPLLKR